MWVDPQVGWVPPTFSNLKVVPTVASKFDPTKMTDCTDPLLLGVNIDSLTLPNQLPSLIPSYFTEYEYTGDSVLERYK